MSRWPATKARRVLLYSVSVGRSSGKPALIEFLKGLGGQITCLLFTMEMRLVHACYRKLHVTPVLPQMIYDINLRDTRSDERRLDF